MQRRNSKVQTQKWKAQFTAHTGTSRVVVVVALSLRSPPTTLFIFIRSPCEVTRAIHITRRRQSHAINQPLLSPADMQPKLFGEAHRCDIRRCDVIGGGECGAQCASHREWRKVILIFLCHSNRRWAGLIRKSCDAQD